jgi:CspA family cold shock protein
MLRANDKLPISETSDRYGSPRNRDGKKMQTGTVKTFNSERGFGFITRDADGTDIFFHVDQVDESVEELFRGQRVSFEEGLSPRSGRPEARDVRIVQWLNPLC